MDKQFWIYMLLCQNGAYYTGMTTDIVRRYRQHVLKTGKCKYTQANPPIRVAQCWSLIGTKSAASKVEKLIQKSARKQKELFVEDPFVLVNLINQDPKYGFQIYPCETNLFEEALKKDGFPRPR